MVTIFLIILIGLVLFIIIKRINKINQKFPTEPFPANWRAILVQRINFYNALDVDEKKRFEYEVQKFLLNTKITGIET
ncbi:MAG: peptidase, partial [Bacteroidetes bacterium]|nr:peptidase [Bacteroidota bacterium]